MKFLTLSFLFLFLATSVFANSTFEGIQSARTVQESKDLWSIRRDRMISLARSLEIPEPTAPPKVRFQQFSQALISRMILKEDLESVSAAIMTPTFQPWNVGTDISILGSVCKRVGDYDFVLMSLMPVAFLDERSGRTLLTEEARQKLKHVLFSRKGSEIYTGFKLDNCIGIKVGDTENHILMTAVAQLLTNELLSKDDKNPEFDNSKNGLNVWMLNHLQDFLKNGFSEFNARPYQGYTWIALTNLYEYTSDPQVKLMAQMTLDYLTAKFATQSKDLRRYGPFRRQIRYLDTESLISGDRVVDWFAMAAGNFETIKEAWNISTENPEAPPENYFSFFAAIQSYRIPDLILDLIIEKKEPIFQKFGERDPEIYFSSPSFLLSSGGRHRNLLDPGDGQNDALGVPTVLIPKNKDLVLSKLFHFLGDDRRFERNNTCVYKNFACGQNFKIPSHVPKSCSSIEKNGWIFYDMQDCKVQYGFYLATKVKGAFDLKADNYGIIEVREASEISFKEFKDRILKNNRSLSMSELSDNVFYSSNGDRITYNFSYKNENLIRKVNGKKQTHGFQFWKFAEGNVVNSKGNGLIEITYGNNSLKLDARNSLQPLRTLK